MIKTQPLSNEETFDAICARLKSASDKRRVATWELVDELLSARETLGERFWQAVEVTQISQGAVENYMRTGDAWPADKRFLNMPFDAHSTLNTLDPDRRTAVMTMAQKAKWDRDELRRRVAAWKAGDEKAFDYRHKVEAPERPARKIVDVPESHARVEDLNGSNEDKPLFDATGTGQAMAAEKRERPDFTASTAQQCLLDAMKAMDAALMNRGALDYETLSAEKLFALADRIKSLAAEVQHAHEMKWKSARKPVSAGADREGDGKSSPRTPDLKVPAAKASEDETGGETDRSAPDGLASRESGGSGSVAPNSNPAPAASDTDGVVTETPSPATLSGPIHGRAPSGEDGLEIPEFLKAGNRPA